MRNPIACAPCRTAKRQCLHDDEPPCRRCKALGRQDTCYFPPPGTSSFHRQTKSQRQKGDQHIDSAEPNKSENTPGVKAEDDTSSPYQTFSQSHPIAHLSPSSSSSSFKRPQLGLSGVAVNSDGDLKAELSTGPSLHSHTPTAKKMRTRSPTSSAQPHIPKPASTIASPPSSIAAALPGRFPLDRPGKYETSSTPVAASVVTANSNSHPDPNLVPPPVPLEKSSSDSTSSPAPSSLSSSSPASSSFPASSHSDDVKAVMDILARTDPYTYFTDEVMNSFFRCSYKWSFFHIPTLLSQVRSRSVDLPIIWSILALSIRFSSTAPPPFSSQIATSNAFAAYARELIHPKLQSPSVDLVRALLMITGHSWGAGDGSKAWMYLGLAVKMTQELNLMEELPNYQKATLTEDEFVEAETRRRTAWTCFLMDSLLSGGRGRQRVLSAADMKIQLPCQDEYYMFGEAVRCEMLSGLLPHSHKPSVHILSSSFSTPGIRLVQPTCSLGIVAYSMRVADIWGNVAHWACSSAPASQVPWLPTSSYHRLMGQVDIWRKSLSPRLEFRTSALHAHTAMGQGQAYVYMHSVYFMCVMFLHRAYIPILGPERKDQIGLTPATISASSQLKQATTATGVGNLESLSHNQSNAGVGDANYENWAQWQSSSRRGLFSTAVTVLDMMEEIRTFGIYFLRGLVPWIGFTIYTAVGVMLYCYNFPTPEDDADIVRRAKERVINGCVFLRLLKNQWPMADSQFLTIKRMQAFYQRLRAVHDCKLPRGMISSEQSVLGEALLDYGAVQVLAPTEAGSTKDVLLPLKSAGGLGSRTGGDDPSRQIQDGPSHHTCQFGGHVHSHQNRVPVQAQSQDGASSRVPADNRPPGLPVSHSNGMSRPWTEGGSDSGAKSAVGSRDGEAFPTLSPSSSLAPRFGSEFGTGGYGPNQHQNDHSRHRGHNTHFGGSSADAHRQLPSSMHPVHPQTSVHSHTHSQLQAHSYPHRSSGPHSGSLRRQFPSQPPSSSDQHAGSNGSSPFHSSSPVNYRYSPQTQTFASSPHSNPPNSLLSSYQRSDYGTHSIAGSASAPSRPDIHKGATHFHPTHLPSTDRVPSLHTSQSHNELSDREKSTGVGFEGGQGPNGSRSLGSFASSPAFSANGSMVGSVGGEGGGGINTFPYPTSHSVPSSANTPIALQHHHNYNNRHQNTNSSSSIHLSSPFPPTPVQAMGSNSLSLPLDSLSPFPVSDSNSKAEPHPPPQYQVIPPSQPFEPMGMFGNSGLPTQCANGLGPAGANIGTVNSGGAAGAGNANGNVGVNYQSDFGGAGATSGMDSGQGANGAKTGVGAGVDYLDNDPLADFDFDFYKDLPPGVDLDSLIADATQSFWKNFPGEFWFSPEGIGLAE